MTNETKNVPELRFPEFDGEWEEKKIGELSQKTISGGTPRTSKLEFWNGDIPWIQSSDLSMNKLYIDSSNKSITEEAIDNSSAKIIPAKSIAIVTRVGVGKLAFVDFKYSTSQDFISLANLTFDTNFSIYSLYNKIKIISKNLQGTSIKGITKNELLNTVLLMPLDIVEQHKIGEFFSKLDQQIELEEKKLAKLEEQKKGYMQKLFSQELRFKDDSGCDYPNWKYNYLGNYMISHDEKTTENNQYPVLTSSREGLFLQKDYFTRDVASKDNTGYNVVPYGYFTYRHMSDDLVFKFNINYIVQKGIVSTLYPVFKTTSDLDNYFLKEILNNGNEFKKYALMQKQGGSRTYMYFSKLKQLKLHIPVLKEQEKISVFLKKLDSLIEKQSSKVELLKQRKLGFLQKMFV